MGYLARLKRRTAKHRDLPITTTEQAVTRTLASNQAIILFELKTTNISSGGFQDLVVLVTLTPVE